VRKSNLVLIPLFSIFLIFFIFPLFYQILLALTDKNNNFTLNNIYYLLNDSLYKASYIRLMFFLILDIAIKFGLGLLAALAIRQLKFMSKLWVVFLLPYVLPLVPAVYTWTNLYHPLWGVINNGLKSIGVINQPILFLGDPHLALFSVIWVHAWRFTPFWMAILLAGLHSLPEEIYESAKIDGASPFKSFTKITLPLMKRFILMNVILSFIWTSGEIAIVWLLTRGGPGDSTHIIGTYAYYYLVGAADFNISSAAILLVFPFIIVLVILFQRIIKSE